MAGLTIDAGMTLDDSSNSLTVTGNAVDDGTFGGNGGQLFFRPGHGLPFDSTHGRNSSAESEASPSSG